MAYIEIVEVLRRAEQGATRPFICEGDNGLRYFVKGRGATRRGQINEWICARLANYFHLPIAEFEIVNVPDDIMTVDMPGVDLSDLGVGPAFGSEAMSLDELNFASIDQVPKELQQELIVFDWWIRNGDRCLTELGGNPNLFWNPRSKELVVIDHNLAFDVDLEKKEFVQTHVFKREIYESLAGDFFRREEFEQRMKSALMAWDAILTTIPVEWNFVDAELTVPTNYNFDVARNTLEEYRTEEFWIWA